MLPHTANQRLLAEQVRIVQNTNFRHRIHDFSSALSVNAASTACVIASVRSLPAIVPIPRAVTDSIADITSAAACLSPRCSSIIAPDQIAAIGLATPRCAISGAEPWTGSNMEGALRSGLILAEAA